MSVMASADINRSVPDVAPQAADEKPERVSLVELRNGKLVIKQKLLSFEKMSDTMQEIVQFREMLEERIERKDPPLTAIPDEHRPLIAKLTQESEKTLAGLAKHIQQELLPAQDEDDEEACKEIQAALSLEVVEKAIKATATRVNYGLDISRVPNAPLGSKIPVAWQIWKWEVKDEYWEWLPKAAREKALVRAAERRQAIEDVLALFQSLPDSDRSAILSGNSKISTTNAKLTPAALAAAKTAAPPPKAPAPPAEPAPAPAPAALPSAPGTPSNPLKRKSGDSDENARQEHSQEPDSPAKPKVGRPKKPLDPEKAAKEKERLEKKMAKAEKEKKEKEAANRSRNLMASFFAKPKGAAAAASGSGSAATAGSHSTSTAPAKEPAATVSEFERTFKPFLLKKDATLAPVNWFAEVRAGRTYKGKEKEQDVIVIDDEDERGARTVQAEAHADEDVQMLDPAEWKAQADADLGQKTAQERLQDSLRSLHPHLRPPALPFPPRRHPTLKSYHPYAVRSIMHQLAEAEVAADDGAVRRLLALLRDRARVPAKVLVFHEDARPGYFGTWTRSSREVGPRAPFARDVVSLDYAADSEAEWEEEEEGGDVLDGDGDDGEEDAAASDDADSDLDSWLVDDDEPVDPGTPVEDRVGSPELMPLQPPPPPKRKTKGEEERRGKRRRVVEPLVPFEKGPCWETTLGECAWEPFKAMRIHFFNDTPCPVDPFKFVAAPVEKLPQVPATAPSAAKPAAQTQSGFAVPALPAHVAASASSAAPADTDAPKQPRAVPVPKTAFPEAAMPVLLATIAELGTGSLAVLVEGVHRALGGAAKKNAIEAKVREVAAKGRDAAGGGKVWVVRPEVRAAYGLV